MSKTENKINMTSAKKQNNTIILKAAEVGDEEQYRWMTESGAENSTLNITANKEYSIKIPNLTDEEHELKIDSNADGKTSQITKSDEIKPESKNIELNFKTPQVGELLHHYKYHADMMNGTINITQ